ncbi:hypothetical protein CERSUDRAFT_80903 [Gelatoporia subvermispora B]|uniref:Carboxylic ester hydrolase n=1 Tax=Ceriporiopsis subvermispora (strain B) TaxID=914234 RepID=M2R4N6_CERS8|nr:hypothetical protein CERSUDRAFT_80903 [Gelatoporia subvermispora B]
MFLSPYALLAFTASFAYAAPSIVNPAVPPVVVLDNATFIGSTNGTVSKFLGIPFAEPPTGDLRFRLPVPVGPYNGTYNVTQYGLSCPQQSQNLFFTPAPIPEGEDCLNLNIWAPSDIQPGANLSVFVWIFGGGFQAGSNSADDGGVIVQRSIELGEPIVYVSMNYRISAFGFLASKEVEEAEVGNIGLWDQRQALRWVQEYISTFGGNPANVTIGGESAGAISVGLQMVTNGGNTEGLFRAAFMSSGSPVPVGNITHGQKYYDALVNDTGCFGTADTLECLRQVPYEKLKAAVDKSPNLSSTQGVNLPWLPRADGIFLTAPPQHLMLNGSVADIPFISGDCDDEGTAFSAFAAVRLDIQTDEQFVDWINETYFSTTPAGRLDELFTLYPDDPAQGSPFGTGNRYQITKQYKRMSALQGDLIFQAPRRFLLEQRSGKQNTWSYLFKGEKDPFLLGFLGSRHASDVPTYFGPGQMTDYLVNFVNHLNPNGPTVDLSWPKYTNASTNLLTFTGESAPFQLNITQDDFRVAAMNEVTELSLEYPL